MGREREKKNLVPNSVPTRPRLENSKKNSKKIEKIKKHHSGFSSVETGMRLAENERKKFYSRIRFLPDPGKKI